MSRLNSSSVSVSITSGGTSTTTAVIQTSNEKLKQLEFHFHLSVLQEGISTDPTRAMATMNSVQVNVSVNHPKAMCFGNNAHAVLQVPNRQTSSANVSTVRCCKSLPLVVCNNFNLMDVYVFLRNYRISLEMSVR